jgi:small-conductance mechanosensitive channel
MSVVVVAGCAMGLMTFPGARQVGASLLASAGVIGIVVGLAAKPVFSNMIAGLQLALAQPIRIDDVLVVEGEWGRVEEITGTFVVVRLWDERCLILPLTYFIEKPFQNWTRSSAQLLGSVFFYVDFGMPLAPLRTELERIVRAAPEWDGRNFVLQVTDATDRAMQLRVLATATTSALAFDLRCRIREGLIDYMQRQYPQFLPRLRIESDAALPVLPAAAAAAIKPQA